jgi:hypothetical protein
MAGRRGAIHPLRGSRGKAGDPAIKADPLLPTLLVMPRQGATGVPHRIDIPIIFDDFSAILPQWPFDRLNLDIFVIA